MPKVSVIIPIYNVENYIRECIESVMNQTLSDGIECILVDDRGNDASMDIAKECIAGYKGRIKFRCIVRDSNGGLSAARNTGIRNATGEYIYFLDSDDIITSACIELLLEKANRYPAADIVCGDFQTFPEKDVHKAISLQGKNFPESSFDKAWIRSIFLSTYPVTAWNKLIRKEFIISNALYFKEGILHEDNHWHAKTYHYVSGLAFVNKVTYNYRLRQGSITMSKGIEKRRLDNLVLIYNEMFAKKVDWDKPWAVWILESLLAVNKYGQIAKIPKESKLINKRLINILCENSSTPLLLNVLLRYFPKCHSVRSINLFCKLYHLCWRIYDFHLNK